MNQNQYVENLFKSSYDFFKSFDELRNSNRLGTYGSSNSNQLKNIFDMAKSFSEFVDASRNITPNNFYNATASVICGRMLNNMQNLRY